jgi:hypothetical protein
METKYKILKISFKKIITQNFNNNILFDALLRTNKIIIQVYHFLRLWILHYYHNKLDIPIISEDIIKIAFNVLSIKSKAGPKLKNDNLKVFNNLSSFYDTQYANLNFSKININNLSSILSYSAISIITSIENNIKANFFNYIKRFVNSSFKKDHDLLINSATDKVKLKKELKSELFLVKKDIIENTFNSDIKYHDWINLHNKNIFPKTFTDSYYFDIQNKPQNYLKGMIYMCIKLEENKCKSFQFFPLRTEIIPKYITLDTKSLNEYLNNLDKHKEQIWNQFFNLKNKIFKQKGYTFDYVILTDCFGSSLQFLNNDFVENEKRKKTNMRNKKNLHKENCKNMTSFDKIKYKENEKNKITIKENEEIARKLIFTNLKKEQRKLLKEQNNKKKENEKNNKIKEKQFLKDEKERIKMLPKDEQKKFKLEQKKIKQEKIKDKENIISKENNDIIKVNKEEKKRSKKIEFPYLEELTDSELAELKVKKKVFVDPGKRVLLYMMDDKGKYLRYSNKKHLFVTKRLKYQKIILNYKKKLEIIKEEEKLSKYNSKSCIIETFKDYIKNKNQINTILMESYKEEKFRKYKWYSYINKKRSFNNLVNEIKGTFGEDIIMVYGDASVGVSMRHFISTPNIGIKRRLKENFKIYSIDEFRTSQLNHKTEEINENLFIKDKKGIKREKHSILTYKMENKRLGCINRDKNAVKNMLKLTNYYMEHKERPYKYKRECKNLKKQKKVTTKRVKCSQA